MNRPEIREYHQTLAEILKSEPEKAKRNEFLDFERTTDQYRFAKEQAKRRNHPVVRVPESHILPGVELEARQTEEIVGNPLATLDIAERELTLQEQTTLWANQVLEEYNSMPKRNSRERRAVKNLAIQAARRLVQNPQDIDIAGSVWKSRETDGESQDVNVKSFYEEVKEESIKAIKKDWEKDSREVSPKQLAGFIKVYANSVLTQDFAHDLLAGYFKGATSRRQRIDAYYNLASAAVDLVGDQQSITEAVRIGIFETDIFPRDPHKMEQVLFCNLPYEDDSVLQKFLIADALVARLVSLTSEQESFRQGIQTNMGITNSDKFKIQWDKEQEKAVQKLGFDGAIQRYTAIHSYVARMAQGPMDYKEFEILKDTWPYNLVFNQNDPLNQKLAASVLERINMEHINEILSKIAKDDERGNLTFLNIVSPQGFIIDIALPEGLMHKRSELARYALNHKFSEEELDSLKRSPSLFASVLVLVPVEFENSRIILTLRKSAGFESNQHPLQSLELIGFPNPRLEDGQELPIANQQLADEIRRGQARFLNRRGVRVPLERTMLSDFGYSSIDFHKDAEDATKTVVKIFVGDVAYSVKLDKYFNFDFEGKRFNAPFIHDSLKFTALSFLKPILCDEKIKTPTGEETDLDKEVMSRMGHLRLLPSGLHRSQQAIANCFVYEGRDLVAQDAERREIRRRVGDPIPDEREYTYVRPVVEREENLPPITLHLPGVVRFRNN